MTAARLVCAVLATAVTPPLRTPVRRRRAAAAGAAIRATAPMAVRPMGTQD